MRKLLGWLFLLCAGMLHAQNLDDYNVSWTTPSRNSSESMPCGGGDIGLNVWVENGDILFYVSRSGTFDENNQMLKLGRVRLNVSSHPFGGRDFKQELILREGGVRISGGGTVVDLWVDVFRPVVHADIQSSEPVTVRASYESWRYQDHTPRGKELDATSYKTAQQFLIETSKDTVAFKGVSVLFYHRNRSDRENIFDRTVRLEGIGSVKAQMFDPVTNRIFGGELRGTNMVVAGIPPAGLSFGQYADAPFEAWTLASQSPSKTHEISLALAVGQTPALEVWKASLAAIWQDASAHRASALAQTHRWWSEFWNRSYIFIDSTDEHVRQASRNYQLFRYMLGCNAYGEFPTKFNGGLFTFDPVYVDKGARFTPDYRRWGGGTMTAQNQRLVYYPMFKSGDFDMLKPQFDFYLRARRNAELRSQVYWRHGGASFTEQIEDFGLPNIAEWGGVGLGSNRPANYDPGMEYNPWLEYLWDTVLEFCSMMLDTGAYQGSDVHQYVPFVESCLTFFDEHYRYLADKRGVKTFDQDGHYVLYPGSATETFKMAYDSASTIAGLQVVLTKLLALPPADLPEAERGRWSAMRQHLPPIPLREIDGHPTSHKIIAPARLWERVQNVEAPQLYPVFPWGLFGIGKPDLQIALNTYLYDPYVVKFRSYVGWKQYNLFAARLGLAEDAAKYTVLKLEDGPFRFPAFWGPGFDWAPDHNWGGTGMLGLQEMLLQCDGDKIYLLPAWPRDWNVRFKLHALHQTIVEASLQGGVLRDLKVTPANRVKDVIRLLPQNISAR